MPDLEDQLRSYGEAAERRSLAVQSVVREVPRRRARHLIAAAAAGIVVVGAALVATNDGDVEHVSVADSPVTSMPSTTEATPPSTATPTTVATSVPPRLATIEGTATWVEGRDERAVLRVGACPVDEVAAGCPTMRSIAVDADGSFELALPTDGAREWNVAAYVIASPSGCVFDCEWRGAQVGPATQISLDAPPDAVALTVTARVVDVFVRDSRGEPFTGGGVQVTDLRCTDRAPACRSEVAPMFMQAAAEDGAVRLVVEPSTRYEVHGQATNTGWDDPAWTNDGNTFWFSESIEVHGRDLEEGYVFLIDGAPDRTA